MNELTFKMHQSHLRWRPREKFMVKYRERLSMLMSRLRANFPAITAVVLLGVFALTAIPGKSNEIGLPPSAFLPEITPSANGSAQGRIALEAPPGFAPELALVFDSEGGDRFMGGGWSLAGLEAVARSAAHGLRYDSTDTYAGPDGTLFYDGTTYRGKNNPHNRYSFAGSADDPTGITATTPDGTQSFYEAKLDAATFGRGRQWGLSRKSDPYGNEYTITYTTSEGEQYPDRIAYKSPSGATDQEITFVYEDRTDPRETRTLYTARTATVQRKRLITITMKSDGNTTRSYHVTYETASPTYASRPRTITTRDSGGAVLNTLTLTYSGGAFGIGGATATSHCVNTDPSCNNYDNFYFRFPDVNGDGIPDLCYRGDNEGVRCHYGTGSGNWNAGANISSGICVNGSSNCNDDDNYGHVYFADLNQDGRDDLLIRYDDGIRTFLSNGSGFTAAASTGICANGHPECNSDDNTVNLALTEINGDGYPDICYRSDSNGIRCHRGDGAGSFEGSAWINSGVCSNGQAECDNNDNYHHIRYMDMDRDGISDLVYRADNGITVRLLRGNSYTGPTTLGICYNGHFECNDADNHTTIRYPDINGDAVPDFCYRSDTDGIKCYRGNGSGGFEGSPYIQNGVCANSDANCNDADNHWYIYYPDINGDGLADLAYRGDNGINHYLNTGTGFVFHELKGECANGHPNCNSDDNYNTIQYVDHDGDGRDELFVRYDNGINEFKGTTGYPDTLTTIDNGTRRVTLTYAATLTSANAIQPANLAYPIVPAQPSRQTLTRTELYVSGTIRAATNYTYSNARKHNSTTIDDRTGAIYERIEARPTVYNAGAPVAETYTVTTYAQTLEHQGAPLRQDTYLTNGTLLSRSESTYSSVTSPFSGHNRNLPVLTQTLNTTNEYDGTTLLQTRTRNSNYDSFGQPQTINQDGVLGSTTDDTTQTISYDPCAPGLKGSIVTRDASSTLMGQTSTTYDTNCKPTQITQGTGGNTKTVSITYDGQGRPVSMSENGLTQTFAYSGERAEITTADGRRIETENDPATGQPLWKRDPDGTYAVTEYNNIGRMTRQCRSTSTNCGGAVEYTARDYSALTASGGTVTETNGLGTSKTVTLNELGQVTQTSSTDDRGTITVTMTYDVFGRMTQRQVQPPSGPSYIAESMTYDSFGRQTTTTQPGPNGAVTFTHDLTPTLVTVAGQIGLERAQTDALGATIYETRDVQNRLIRRDFQTTENGATIWSSERTTYDARELPTLIERGTGASRGAIAYTASKNSAITYDILGRKIIQTDPNKGNIVYQYAGNGKLAQKITGDGKSEYYEYDSAGRIARVKDHDFNISASYTYGTSGVENGKVKTITDESSVRTFNYDPASGQPSRVARTFEGGKDFDISIEYDQFRRPVKKTFEGVNASLEYGYFNTGALRAITLRDPDRRILASGDTYNIAVYDNLDANGKPRDLEYGNGINLTYGYQTETGLLTSMTAVGSSTIASKTYAYRDDSLLAQMNDGIDGAYSESYTYDAAHRLTQAIGPYGDTGLPVRTVQYRYAADGNLTYNGEALETQNYASSKPHAITSTQSGKGYLYDNRGSLTQRTLPQGNMLLTYTHQNRPRKIEITDTNGQFSTTRFVYDDQGQRFKKDFLSGSVNVETYYPDEDYQIRMNDVEEVHTLVARKPDGAIGTFTFRYSQLTAGLGADNIHFGRALAVTGFTSAAFLERFGHLKRFFEHWKHTQKFVIGVVVVFLLLIPIVLLIRNNREQTIALVKSPWGLINEPIRAVAFTIVTVFVVQTTTACINQEKPGFPMIWTLPTTNGELSPYVTEQLGHHFYVSNHLRSNYLVTDSTGKVVTRYVYLPYGKLNMDLTNADMDGDGQPFNITSRYTGQEYDYETGLYNYNARLYDPDTGRFLQTDPKHKDMPGWSNYDRYGYVHGNPINMIDPSGEIAWQVWAAAGVAAHGGDSSRAMDSLKSNYANAIGSINNVLGKIYQFRAGNPLLLPNKNVQKVLDQGIAGLQNMSYALQNGGRAMDTRDYYEKELLKPINKINFSKTYEYVAAVAIKSFAFYAMKAFGSFFALFAVPGRILLDGITAYQRKECKFITVCILKEATDPYGKYQDIYSEYRGDWLTNFYKGQASEIVTQLGSDAIGSSVTLLAAGFAAGYILCLDLRPVCHSILDEHVHPLPNNKDSRIPNPMHLPFPQR